MDWPYLALAALGLFLAGVVKGTTGLGYSSCALPFLVSAIGLKAAIVVVVIPAMLSNVMVVSSTGHLRETLVRFWPLYAATRPGIAIGLTLLVCRSASCHEGPGNSHRSLCFPGPDAAIAGFVRKA